MAWWKSAQDKEREAEERRQQEDHDALVKKESKRLALERGNCRTCGNPASWDDHLSQLVSTYHYINAGYYCKKCWDDANNKASEQYIWDVNLKYELTTRDTEERYKTPNPFVIPKLTKKQLFNLDDPEHPKNSCFQCSDRLPGNYHTFFWNEGAGESKPMFCTLRCKETALRKHYRKPKERELYEEDEDTDMGKKLTNVASERLNRADLKQADDNAYKDLTSEFKRALRRYDSKKHAAEEAEREKERKRVEALKRR